MILRCGKAADYAALLTPIIKAFSRTKAAKVQMTRCRILVGRCEEGHVTVCHVAKIAADLRYKWYSGFRSSRAQADGYDGEADHVVRRIDMV